MRHNAKSKFVSLPKANRGVLNLEDPQEYFRSQLYERYMGMRLKNSSFSMRAFARLLGQNPAAISQIFNRKRNVSEKFAVRIMQKLSFDPSRVSYVSRLFSQKKSGFTISDLDEEVFTKNHTPLDPLDYEMIADWRYFAVLSLFETAGNQSDSGWISKRLSIPEIRAQKILEELEAKDFLRLNNTGELELSSGQLCSSDGVASAALQQRHENNLDDAKEAIFLNSLEERDFTSFTIAINPKQLPKAKKMIRKFIDTLEQTLSEGEKTEVYEACLCLFPRTNLQQPDLMDP